mgnify:CR=1 FL=1
MTAKGIGQQVLEIQIAHWLDAEAVVHHIEAIALEFIQVYGFRDVGEIDPAKMRQLTDKHRVVC